MSGKSHLRIRLMHTDNGSLDGQATPYCRALRRECLEHCLVCVAKGQPVIGSLYQYARSAIAREVGDGER